MEIRLGWTERRISVYWQCLLCTFYHQFRRSYQTEPWSMPDPYCVLWSVDPLWRSPVLLILIRLLWIYPAKSDLSSRFSYRTLSGPCGLWLNGLGCEVSASFIRVYVLPGESNSRCSQGVMKRNVFKKNFSFYARNSLTLRFTNWWRGWKEKTIR